MRNQNRIVAKVSQSLPWAFLESVISAVASLLTVILVARFLQPDEFGQAGIAMAICAIVQASMLGGMPDAVNRAKVLDSALIDSFFWCVTLIGLGGTAVCGLIALGIGYYAANWNLAALAAVQGLSCIAFAVAAVPTGLLLRKMRTRKLATRTFLSKLTGLSMSALLAIAGFGPWSLVVGNVAGQLVGAGQLVLGMARKPKLTIKREGMRGMLSLGLLAGMQQTLNSLTTRGFIIAFATIYGAHAVGIFNFALRLVEESGNLINNTSRRVAVASFASAQRTGVNIRPLFLAGTLAVTYLSAPVFAGAAVIMPDAVPLVFGDKWTAAVPAIQILLLMWLIRSTRLLAPAVMLAQGEARTLVWSALAGMATTAVAFALSLPFGEFWSTLAYAGMLFGTMPAGLLFISRIGKVTIRDQIAACNKPVMFSLMMAGLLLLFRMIMQGKFNKILLLVATIALGVVIFSALVLMFDRKNFRQLTKLIRPQH